MANSPTVKVQKAVEGAVKHESTSLLTRGLIGLAVAYICWASNRLVTKFDIATEKHGQVIEELGKQIERIAVTLNGTEKTIERIEANQKDIRNKVEQHSREPYHNAMGMKAEQMAEDIREVKNELKKRNR